MKQFLAAFTALLFLILSYPAEARHHRYHHRIHHYNPQTAVADANGNGIVKSHKTGATARVGSAYASNFQAYIDDLEAHGATIKFMGGNRSGRCSSGHLHSCGKALDVCQLSRGRVDSRCNLPSRSNIATIAAAHGLFEGGQWCNSDYGHAQVGVSAAACGERTYAARRHRSRLASERRNNVREARVTFQPIGLRDQYY